MKFIRLNGRTGDSGSYISIGIEGGDNNDTIGDQVWISDDGFEMEVSENADEEVLRDAMNLFEGNDKRAFRGAMARMGVYFTRREERSE